MKLVFVSSSLGDQWGGPSLSESTLVRKMKPYCDVEVLCPADKLSIDFAKKQGLEKVKSYRPAEVFAAWLLGKHWICEKIKNADLVHINGHWRWENHFLARLAVRYDKPFVLHPRGMCLVGHRKVLLKKTFNALIGNYIVRKASRIIVLSHFEAKQLAPYSVDDKKIVVIPNGIYSSDKDILLEAEESSPVEGKYFLYLGRLETRKNLLFLVEAFAKYLERGGKARLICVGPVEHGYDKQIKAKSVELKVDDRVDILKPAYGSRKWQYMRSASAVLYPSYDEAFGRVPFEAILAGTYPIVSDASGGAEYLGRFLNKGIYRHNDCEDLATQLQAMEESEAEEDLKKAEAWVREELNWGRVAQSVCEMYQTL